MPDSAKTRRQIRFVKKQIQRYCSTVAQTLADYDVDAEKRDFTLLDNDQLESLRFELHSTKSNLLKAYNRITLLHEEWAQLQQSDAGEAQLFNEYLAKYGDYRTSASEAVSRLEELDHLLDDLDNEFHKRNIDISSGSSDATSADDQHNLRGIRQDQHFIRTEPINRWNSTPITTQNTTVPPYNASLLNFVDASILSKMELPTFDGNILEYPEFASRFATLVGNKVELDNTTKFSLLKSCLRGPALNAIQGLSLTSENYKTAMDILKTHYDDKVTIKHILYSRLADLPVCDPEGRHLHSLYNQMFALVRQFTDGNDDSKETGLGAILLNKLPLRVRSQIYDRTSNSHNLSPSELLHLLTDIVRKDTTLLEMSSHPRPVTEHNQHHTFHVSSKSRGKRPTPLGHTRSQQQTKPCAYCKSGQHPPINCNVITTPRRRIKYVRERRLCFNCLSNQHTTKTCPSKRVCIFCSKRHHSSLCFSRDQKETRKLNDGMSSEPMNQRSSTKRQHFTHVAARNSDQDSEKTSEERDDTTAVTTTTSNSSTLTTNTVSSAATLMCTTVSLFNPFDESKSVDVIAFLDSGSSHSYICDSLAKTLNLPVIKPEYVSISTFGTSTPLHLTSNNHVVGIRTRSGAQKLNVKSLTTLTGNLIFARQERIRDGNAVKICNGQASLLIGNDYFWDIILTNDFSYETLPNGFRRLHTSIGDILTGKVFDFKKANAFVSVLSDDSMQHPANYDSLTELVHKFWTLESVGITDNPNQKDDDVCLQFFNDSIAYDDKDGRYIVKLPFKVDPTHLCDNYSMAYCRLLTLQKSLSQNPKYMTKYNDIIVDQLQRGIIEKVPASDLQSPCHYLSHHGVVKSNDGEVKVRCVFDGSAKRKGQLSINEMLYRGPVLLPDLTGILLRCRIPKYLISSDIEKAFLMVGLHPDSRNYTRFLWLKDPRAPPSPDNVVTYRFTRVPFGLICSPFLLSGTIHHHLTTQQTSLSSNLLRNTYVDNVFHGVQNITEGKNFYQASKDLFQKAGMNLRAYVSNCRDLNDFFETSDSGTTAPMQKLLGLQWNTTTDELSISLPFKKASASITATWTKRKVLKEVASIYDPLGLLTPTTLLGKLFLQSLWKTNKGWDDLLSEEQHSQWFQVMKSWDTPHVTLNRQLFPNYNDGTITYVLHVFVDASAQAYCAAAYIVQHRRDSKKQVSLIMAKARLAPLHQPMTIPRLELSALAVGAKLITYISEQMDIPFERKFLWTDSTVALAWTKSDKQVPVFVRNRVKTIQEHTSDVTIKYVPTDCNPADIGTRGTTITALQNTPLWWIGPEFLTLDETQWPQSAASSPTPIAIQPSQGQDQNEEVFVAVTKNNAQRDDSEQVIDASRFSKWTTLHNTIATVLRFLSMKFNKTASIFGENQVELMQKAEVILLRIAQQEVPPTEDQKKQLHLFQCKTTSLWKSDGRIKNANLSRDAITPIFLPCGHHITTLLILSIHCRNNHCGLNHTLTELRQKFWIPKGRSTVKKALNKHCYHCKRYKAKPFTLPPFPDHPIQRVTPPQYPFQRMGMDFFGPMQYKSDYNTAEKYWMLLFTCLNSRAVYVDIVLNMTTQSVLHVLRRFIATVGCPTWILCDNALSFKKVAECYSSLSATTMDEDIVDYCSQRRIHVKFIPSLSPWQGGLYEKMVDVFKKSFRHAIGNNLLPLDDIKTIAKEAEAIVNTRPLTYISDDFEHIPLRPVDFLRPSTLLCGPQPGERLAHEWQPIDDTRNTLITTWQKTSRMLNVFWKRWSTEYLTSLREQYKSTHKKPRSYQEEEPHLGDIVLIHDATLNKGQWKRGKIIGSSDDYKRSVEIRLPSKKTITRPLNLVYKFEISSTNGTTPDTTSNPTRSQDEERPSKDNNNKNDGPSRSKHHMTTRSKARHQTNLLATCISIISLCQLTPALNTRCPTDTIANKTILYATNCAKEGIAIARYHDVNEEQFCWFPVSCPFGAIRSEFPMKPNATLCGTSCDCPGWATSCSFTETDRTSWSELALVPQYLRNYQPRQVCSFEKSQKCDGRKQVGRFHQVQLFDDNIILVEELAIRIKEYVDENDFTCVDKKGWKRLPKRSITGTSRFCERHQCKPNARLFCAYGNPMAMLVINDSDSSTMIPIKAWGTVTKSFFGFPTVTTEGKKSGTKFSMIEGTCAIGGISLRSKTLIEVAEVCIRNYCVFLKNFTSQTITFPNSLIMYDHLVSIRTWSNGKLFNDSELACKAHAICETLQCYICWERLYNTQCWTYKLFIAVPIISCLLLLMAPTIYVLLKTVRLIVYIAYVVLRKLHATFPSSPGRLHQPIHLPKYTSQRRRNRRRTIMTCVILILFHLNTVKGCSEVISVTTSEEVCRVDKNKQTCTFNHVTIITLQPLQQQTCLTLHSPQKLPMGMLTIKPEGVKFRCNRKNEFYTRDHEIVSESVHRCHRAGSCHADRCHEVKETDKLKEFSDIANNSPGYTSCSSSCGGLTCDGCFFSVPSCLFHRLYAVPTTSTIYTIFRCPSWELEVNAEVSLQGEDEIITTTVRLLPGRTSTWNNIHFSLIGTIVPQLPILSSTFITDGQQTSIINPAHAGELQSHSAGQLQCSSHQAAEQFDCYFPRHACTCTTALHSATCTCSNGNIRDRMAPQPLPQASKNFIIFQSNADIYSRANIGSAIQLQIAAEDLRLTALKHISRCQVEPSDLSGCYSCTTGASLTLSCTSDNDEVLAHIECDKHSHVIRCTESGYLNTIFFMFDTTSVNTNCIAVCPGGTVNFTIKGSLAFINERAISSDVSITNVQKEVESDLSFARDIFVTFKDTIVTAAKGVASFFSVWEIFFILLPIFIIVTLLLKICSRTRHHKSN